ncbi:hypothetical protein DID80_00865 [Candidatus Marinamargulisbacteria bacterium SCGC AAA071-K20]|nr:hypothetical protein DID80_00865 [Candidatus Marinamargulisbacteria bacterium SCGC AAA071-K20]
MIFFMFIIIPDNNLSFDLQKTPYLSSSHWEISYLEKMWVTIYPLSPKMLSSKIAEIVALRRSSGGTALSLL